MAHPINLKAITASVQANVAELLSHNKKVDAAFSVAAAKLKSLLPPNAAYAVHATKEWLAVASFLLLLSLLVLLGLTKQLVDAAGFAYPAYKVLRTLQAPEGSDKRRFAAKQWLTYLLLFVLLLVRGCRLPYVCLCVYSYVLVTGSLVYPYPSAVSPSYHISHHHTRSRLLHSPLHCLIPPPLNSLPLAHRSRRRLTCGCTTGAFPSTTSSSQCGAGLCFSLPFRSSALVFIFLPRILFYPSRFSLTPLPTTTTYLLRFAALVYLYSPITKGSVLLYDAGKCPRIPPIHMPMYPYICMNM